MGEQPRPSHVVMRDGGFTCLHCGDHQVVTIPQLVESMVAMGRAWANVHMRCPPPPLPIQETANP